MAVPYTFGSATAAIPLSQLDSNFASTITLGNTAIQLGNTVTILNNMTFANVTVSSGTVSVTTATATTANLVTINATTLNAATHRSDTSLVLQTNGTTTAVTIDTAQNMGLGVTPSAWSAGKAIETGYVGNGVWGFNNNNFLITQNAYYNGGWKYASTGPLQASYYQQTNGTHAWNIAGAGTVGNAITFNQAMTLDNSGNLGVGTTSPTQKITVSGSIRATGNSTNFNETGAQIDAYQGMRLCSYISTGSAIQFLTNPNGGNTAEVGRFDSSGNLLVGTTNGSSNQYTAGSLNLGGSIVTAGYKYCVISYNTGGSGAAVSFQKAGTEKSAMFFNESDSRLYVFNGGSAFGVYMSTNATSWTANSDERLKTDLLPIENAAQKVSTLRAVTGRYKTDEESVSRAFLIAQDVQAVLPQAVDASDPEKLGVQYTDVIPLLVAAIKEQQAIIETLTNRITALEGAAK